MNGSFCFSGATKRTQKKEAKMSCWLNAEGGRDEEEQQGEEVKKCKKSKRARDPSD